MVDRRIARRPGRCAPSMNPSELIDKQIADLTDLAELLPDYDSRPCSRSFLYKFRSLIPRILAAFPR